MSTFLYQAHCFGGAMAVVLGAFGSHGLKKRVGDLKLLETWDTAVKYHFTHSLVGLISVIQRNYNYGKKPGNYPKGPKQTQLYSSLLCLAGNVIFSGSLYALVLTEQKKLGAITPIGGLCYIAAWVALAFDW